jgi:hypothetical protein
MAPAATGRATAVLLVLLLPPPLARADYKDTYRKGIEAVDRKRWPEVARLMREAIAENAKEGERIKLYGLRFEAYVPHFYLGLALVNAGDCAGAVQAFDASEAAGAIRSTPRYADLLDGRKTCASRLAKAPVPPLPSPRVAPAPPSPDNAALTQTVQAAEAAMARAEAALREVASLMTDPALAAWGRDPANGAVQGEAKDALVAARAKLNAGRATGDRASVAEARELALRAGQRLEALRDEGLSRREALLKTAPQEGLPSPAASERPAVPPAALLKAARAYFDGRYEESLALLARPADLRGRAAAQSHLFRAAARFALYRAGREREATLRAQAAQDVVACRRADASLAPDPQAFSPAFAEFFRRSR